MFNFKFLLFGVVVVLKVFAFCFSPFGGTPGRMLLGMPLDASSIETIGTKIKVA